MSAPKHTPTPWRIYRDHPRPATAAALVYIDAAHRRSYSGLEIAAIYNATAGSEEEANAEHIVRCVNLFPELVAELELVLRYQKHVGGFTAEVEAQMELLLDRCKES